MRTRSLSNNFLVRLWTVLTGIFSLAAISLFDRPVTSKFKIAWSRSSSMLESLVLLPNMVPGVVLSPINVPCYTAKYQINAFISSRIPGRWKEWAAPGNHDNWLEKTSIIRFSTATVSHRRILRYDSRRQQSRLTYAFNTAYEHFVAEKDQAHYW